MRPRRKFRGAPNRTRVNGDIRSPKIRVIGPEGDQLGIMDPREAIEIAVRHNLDLVEISPSARPPVCKILDYGKHKYEQKKKAAEAKKKQVQQQVKEVKFRPKTDVHDIEFKVKHVNRFLDENNKVKLTVFFRGREMIYTNQGKDLLQKVFSLVEEKAQKDTDPVMEGRTMSMVISPKSGKGKTDVKLQEAPAEE